MKRKLLSEATLHWLAPPFLFSLAYGSRIVGRRLSGATVGVNNLPTIGRTLLEHHGPLRDVVVLLSFVVEDGVLSESDDRSMTFGEDSARIKGYDFHRFRCNIST